MKSQEEHSYMANDNIWGIPDIMNNGGGPGSFDHNSGIFFDQSKPSYLYRSPSSNSLYNMPKS